jgi:hypothetical protein
MTPDTIAALYGVKLNRDRHPKEFRNWDGEQINCKDMKDDLILHEISHYIVATPERRKIVDYGLGYGPNANRWADGAVSYATMSFDESNREEVVTCTIESILAALCSINPVELLRDRNFITSSNHWDIKRDFDESIDWLQTKSIINRAWFPAQLQPAISLAAWARLTNFKRALKKVE